jgi:arylsulfatase A-like enzyme
MRRSLTERVKPASSAREGLWLACILGWLFAAPAAWEVWLGSARLFATDSDVSVILDGSMWTTPLGQDLILFMLAQLLVHAAFGVACWLLALLTLHAWPRSGLSRRQWVLVWLVLTGFWLLLIHSVQFPRTYLGGRYRAMAHAEWLGIELWQLVTCTVAAALGAILIPAAIRFWRARRFRTPRIRAKALVVVGVCCALSAVAFLNPGSRSGATAESPHVILLGIDSLRPERTAGSAGPALTPRIDEFLQPAVVFDDAITPLPRTYPSWVSLLTGRHPHTTGAIVNLLPREKVDTAGSLPELLRARGYKTVYAIDEVRFSNIDKSYGFDTTISPPIGAADFLLGVMSDMPLSNLIANTRLGHALFPHAYANRAFAKLYDPDTFVERLRRNLDFEQPTLLALHLTLAHWPYTWRDATDKAADGLPRLVAAYQAAVRRVDTQFGDIAALLQQLGALDNAIVVVFSDHGEALGEAEDLPYGHAESASAPAFPSGHGTSVLSPNQYRILLAWRSFGQTPLSPLDPGNRTVPASLQDVAPTLVDALGLPTARPTEGLSMFNVLRGIPGSDAAFADRIRFTETEFNPPGFEPGATPNPEQFRSAVSNYVLNRDSGRLQLTEAAIDTAVLYNRQYAALRNDTLLAALPQEGQRYEYVAVDRARRSSRAVDNPPDPAGSEDDLSELWQALHTRFPVLGREPADPHP